MNPLPAEFFARFGLYAKREFLSPEVCASLRHEMRAATGAPATVADERGEAVEETSRRTKQAEVSPTTTARIRSMTSVSGPISCSMPASLGSMRDVNAKAPIGLRLWSARAPGA